MQIFSQNVAVSTGKSLVPPGPRVPATDAIIEAEGLRAAAYTAAEHVAALSKLSAVQHWDATTVANDVEILVVDRPGWIQANAGSLQVMLEPAFRELEETNPQLVKSIGSGATAAFSGAQVGSVLAFLSTKVLGQFEPYAAQASGENPRLLLVAPNVMMIRDELNLDAADFRFWVSLHELTHVAQFAQAPWLADHILGIATEYLTTNLLPGGESDLSAADKAERTETLEAQITGVMSLLEGHANVIMDAVDRRMVPTVRTIRERFDARSSKFKWFSQVLRKIFGLEAKAKQYKKGQNFVAAVVERVGMERFNVVWQRPENLPTADELRDADAWISRVLGSGS